MNNIPALVQIIARRPSGDKALSELMIVNYWGTYASLGLNGLMRTGYLYMRRLTGSPLAKMMAWSMLTIIWANADILQFEPKHMELKNG